MRPGSASTSSQKRSRLNQESRHNLDWKMVQIEFSGFLLAYLRSERADSRFLLCYLLHMYINLSKSLQLLQPHMYTHGDAPSKGQTNKPRDQLTEPGQRKPTASFHDKFSSPYPVSERKEGSHRSILIMSPSPDCCA